MPRKTILAALTLAIVTAASAAPARAPDAWTFSGPASRITGTYTTEAQVRPCGTSAPYQTVSNTMSFNYGGTVLENPRFPPPGVQNAFGIPGQFTRNVGLGSWSYDPHQHNFAMSLRFDFFVDGVWSGITIADRAIRLSADGNTASGSVHVVMYNPDGNVLRNLCGTAVSTRV